MAEKKAGKLVEISGWVEDAPKFGYTRQFVAVCTFTVGFSGAYGKVKYLKVAAGGCGAEQCFQRLQKGMYISVAGWLWQKSYFDKQKRQQIQTVLIAESIQQQDKHQGQITAGLFYKGIMPPAVGYYTVGDGPFEKICQLEFMNYSGLEMKGGAVNGEQ